jgi:L-iditol 2-dehydrogenase
VAGTAGSHVISARLHAVRDVRVAREAAATPGPGEVNVSVAAVGLCGSDLHWYEEGAIGDAVLGHPLVLGHEFSGRLDDGTLVAADPCIPCGTCPPCVAGREHICIDSRFAGHGSTDGALRSSMPWPLRLLRPLPPSCSEDEGALMEPLGVALHAVDLGGVRPGERAAVIGCGPIGLLIVQVLRAAGAGPIRAADPLPHRLAAAVRLGAEDAAVETGAEVEVVFEAAGTDEALATALDLVRPGGRVVLVGIPAGDRTSFAASRARRKEVVLLACRRMRGQDLDRAIALAASGAVDLAGLVTHRHPLAEAPAAFAMLASRAGIKVIVRP